MALDQIVQAATSPITEIVIILILAVLVSPWLKAHQKQVDAATAGIQDATLRALAQDAVRWLESDPAQAQLPGLVQRANGIDWLVQRTGLSKSVVAPILDAAYNALTATGQVVLAPQPKEPAAAPMLDLGAVAAEVLAQLRAAQPTAPISGPAFVNVSAEPVPVAPAPVLVEQPAT